MTEPAKTEQRPAQISWLLQIQHKPGTAWNDHTSGLVPREDATAFMAERRAAYPGCRYRLVRAQTTFTVEPEGAAS